MCYSAQLWSDYRKYVREFRAKVGITQFRNLFFSRSQGASMLVPRAMELAFANPQTEEEHELWQCILERRLIDAREFEQGMFEQITRLNDAQRKIAAKPDKPNKGAHEDVRIATKKIAWAKEKIADLHRNEPTAEDARIFPGWYAPVMTMLDGELIVRPMRYHCRPARVPSKNDELFPGTFNARIDSLEKYWRGEWCHTHAVVNIQAFFEHVFLHRAEGRELLPGEQPRDTVIQFRPEGDQDMLLACVWSHWKPPAGSDEPELLSFAFIMDDPPPEVEAAGHDRCPIPIKRENLAAWLNPDPANKEAQYAILQDRERPYYHHYLKAA